MASAARHELDLSGPPGKVTAAKLGEDEILGDVLAWLGHGVAAAKLGIGLGFGGNGAGYADRLGWHRIIQQI